MTRRKVKLAFILNSSERKNTYKKRKNSMLKKTEEISTLCGIVACAIIYSPYDLEPQIWPTDDSVVRNVVERFRALPQWEQSKNMVDKNEFTAQSILKKREQLRKLEKGNKEQEMTMFMFQCVGAGTVLPQPNINVDDFRNLSSIIDQNINDISRRVETLSINSEMIPNQPQMQKESHQQPQIQAQSYQTLVEIPPYGPYQSQNQTQLYQTLTETQAYQPQMPSPSFQNLTEGSQGLIHTQSFQTLMEPSTYQPQIPTQPYQTLVETQANQPQVQTQSFQALMKPSAYQSQIPTQPYQTLVETQAYQPQVQTESFQALMETPAYPPYMQTQPYQAQMEALAYQPQRQTTTLANTEGMTLVNDGHMSNMNDNPNMPSQWFVNMLSGNEDETVMPPSGDFNFPL